MTSRSGDWIKVRSVAVCDIGTHSLQREDGHAETLLMVPGAVRARHTRSLGSDGRAVSRSGEKSEDGGHKGSARKWRPCTPAIAAGLTDHIWTLREVWLFRVPPWPQPQTLYGIGKDGSCTCARRVMQMDLSGAGRVV